MSRIYAGCLGLFALLTSAATVRGDIIVDNFTDNQSVTATNQAGFGGSNPNTGSLSALPGVLGGDRTFFVQATSGPPGSLAQLLSSAGTLSFSTGTFVTGNFLITYPSIGTLDLTNAASYDFNVSANDNGGTFSLTLYDGTTSKTSSVQAGLINGIPGDGKKGAFGIGILGNGDFAGLNLATISKIEFGFSGDLETDVGLSNLGFVIRTNIPEPASLAVWGIVGVIGAAGWYRRRRQLAGSVMAA